MSDFHYRNNKKLVPDNNQLEEFSISRFHLIRHIIALVLTAGLSFCLVASEFSRCIRTNQSISIGPSTLPYLVLLLFIAVIALTAIFSVRKVTLYADGIRISNLFWSEKVPWPDLHFHSAKSLIYAWLKTKCCFYLLVKGEFTAYLELEQLLSRYIDIKN